MSYENATATKLLATNCVCCGRSLVDAVSVELGIGPECREGFNADLTDDSRKEANRLVFEASIAAVQGKIEVVRANAEKVGQMGYGELAEKMVRRFQKAEKLADIEIVQDGMMYRVTTPYRRKDSKVFIDAWRSIPGRRWENGANVVPVTSKAALWELLQQFFAGKYAKGPKGVFKIPAPAPSLKQGVLKLS